MYRLKGETEMDIKSNNTNNSDEFWAYPCNIDASDRFDQFRHFVYDGQYFSGQFCGANFTTATRYHCNFLGLRQWCGNFGSNLIEKKTNLDWVLVDSTKSIKYTFGNVSSNISTMAASRYSRQASAFLDICSASALALAAMANASAWPRIVIC